MPRSTLLLLVWLTGTAAFVSPARAPRLGRSGSRSSQVVLQEDLAAKRAESGKAAAVSLVAGTAGGLPFLLLSKFAQIPPGFSETSWEFQADGLALMLLLFGVVYLRMARDQTSIQDRTGILFFQAMNQAFGSAIGISKIIPQQLKVVSRERAARMYTPLPYYVSTFLVTLPLELVPGVIYGTVIYYMTALREGVKHYLVFLSVMTLENFAGIGLGMCLSASFTSVEMAPQLAPAFVILFLMFSGFFLNESNVPVWLIWLREISFIRYAFQALCVNEFKGAEFSCDGSTGSCVDGDEHLERLKFDDITISGNCGILAGMILGFNLLALGIVYYRQPKYLALEKKTQ